MLKVTLNTKRKLLTVKLKIIPQNIDGKTEKTKQNKKTTKYSQFTWNYWHWNWKDWQKYELITDNEMK